MLLQEGVVVTRAERPLENQTAGGPHKCLFAHLTPSPLLTVPLVSSVKGLMGESSPGLTEALGSVHLSLQPVDVSLFPSPLKVILT